MPTEPQTPTKPHRQRPYPTPTSHSKSDKSHTYSKRSDLPSPPKVIHIDYSDSSPSPSKPVEIEDNDDDDDVKMEAADDAPYSPPASATDDSDVESVFDPESEGGSVFDPESDEDIKTSLKGKKSAKATSSARAGKATATKARKVQPRASGGASGIGKGTPWTPEQDLAFFKLRYPKTPVKWAEVAKATGRDAKASPPSSPA